MLYNGKNTTQAWGLIVLLISKAAGHAPTVPDMEQDKSAGVLHSQRGLVEVTEMIRIAHLVHTVKIFIFFVVKKKIFENFYKCFGNTKNS